MVSKYVKTMYICSQCELLFPSINYSVFQLIYIIIINKNITHIPGDKLHIPKMTCKLNFNSTLKYF